MASTRSQSTRSTRSSKPLTTPTETSMEVDEVVSGLQQLARGATDFSKSSPTDHQNNKLKETKGGDSGTTPGDGSSTTTTTTTDCSFPNNLLDAAASSTAMETDPAAAESSSDSSSSDSSDSSDSEDTSETDEETAAKNKLQDQEDLQILEKMFLYAREQAYDEKMRAVNTKLEEVHSGRAKEYLKPLEELQKHMMVKIEIASQRRRYRISNVKHKSDSEKLAAPQNLESDTQLLYDNIKLDLEDNMRRLEEDRHNDFSSDFWYEGILKKKNKKSIDLFGERKKKPCNVNGPYIVYMISDVDIMEDWTAIKKVLAAPKRKCVDPLVF